MHTINRFSGPHAYLSNFYITPVLYNGHTWPSSEHAFMSAKSNCPVFQQALRNATTPSAAKKLGRKVRIRDDWGTVKNTVMLDVLRAKFSPGSGLAFCLVSTGDLRLVEGNTWGDTYWGVCRGVGENWLGVTLQQVRAELQGKPNA